MKATDNKKSVFEVRNTVVTMEIELGTVSETQTVNVEQYMLSNSNKGGADRILFLLVIFSQANEPLSFSDLMEKSSLPQSTLYRHLAVLKKWGFVVESNAQYHFQYERKSAVAH